MTPPVIEFEEPPEFPKRRYLLDGEAVPSVTTVLDVLANRYLQSSGGSSNSMTGGVMPAPRPSRCPSAAPGWSGNRHLFWSGT